MPWCPECERFLSPPTVQADGTCPRCGHEVVRTQTVESTTEEEYPPVPFHLKALGIAAAVYLGWRLVQGVAWVVQHI